VARKLEKEKVPVDLLITLDPVTPPDVPPNVRHCVNLYQSNGLLDYLPFLRGVPLKAEEKIPDQVVNSDLREDRRDLLEPLTNHFTIEKEQKVQEEVIRVISQICPPRAQWLAQRTQPGLPNVTARDAMSAGATIRPENHAPLSAGGANRGSLDTQGGN
jgi:hypothetical protein